MIAAVQAYVLAQLLFEQPRAAERGGAEALLEPSDAQRDEALVLALAHILWQAGQQRRAVVLLRQGSESVTSRNFESATVKYTFDTLPATQDFLRSRLGVIKEEEGCFVTLLMYSALFSRGLDEVKADMDVASNTMIAAHGYCSQEVVTLLLTGKAHSNVFDGTLEGVMDTPMKGIVERCKLRDYR